MTKWYTFSQNNSGGLFDLNNHVSHYVCLEAKDDNEANGRALGIGVYFAGVASGKDCPCCGDRWSPVSDMDSNNVPHINGQPLRRVSLAKYNTALSCSILATVAVVHPMKGKPYFAIANPVPSPWDKQEAKESKPEAGRVVRTGRVVSSKAAKVRRPGRPQAVRNRKAAPGTLSRRTDKTGRKTKN